MTAPTFAPPLRVRLPPARHRLPSLSPRLRARPLASAANLPFRDPCPSRLPLPPDAPLLSIPPPATVRPAIRLLASDLDGTLLTAAKQIHPANVEAVLAAISRGLLFIPATGKSRAGAIRAMGPLAAHLQAAAAGDFPGIFLNGLLVFGRAGDVIFERCLARDHALYILEQAERSGLTVLFYAGDRVLVRERTLETDMFIVSHEPVPTAVGDLAEAVRGTAVHKALLVDPRKDVVRYRREMTDAFAGVADITQARPDVLEVLPVGASKGEAFVTLLDHLGVEKEHTMAIGDGENDVEMIKAAGLGVAVANAVPEMLSVADEVVCANDEAAVEEAIRRYVACQ